MIVTFIVCLFCYHCYQCSQCAVCKVDDIIYLFVKNIYLYSVKKLHCSVVRALM